MDEPQSDINLVKLAQNGDRLAFQELVERYNRRVWRVCFGVSRNADDAEDLTQEAFVKAYRNLPRFHGNSSFYTWIYRIATNVSIDFLRRQKRRKTVDYDDGIGHDDVHDEHSLLPSTTGFNPARALGRRELVEKLNQAMLSLSDNHRQVVVLREVEGLSYQEIADVLEISIGTVMSRLHHARKNLQKELSEYLGRDTGGA